MEFIFTDENQTCQIDFTNAVWATDQLNSIFSVVKDSILSDVDFIVEGANSIFFIEVKNSNFLSVDNPKAFKPLHEDLIRVLAKKFFDSFHYVRGLGKTSDKQKIYICLIETPLDDSVMRRALRNRLKDRLPFKLQKIFSEKMIDDVLVWSFDEWNEYFPQFPLSRLKPPLQS